VIKARESKEVTKELIIARRLLNGDLLLSTLFKNARTSLKRNKN
jgi:hypothetical protein